MAKVPTISPTMLNEFRTCPKKFEGRYITKEVKFVSSPAITFGLNAHNAIEYYLTKKVPMYDEFAFMMPYAEWVLSMEKQGLELFVEHGMAINWDMKTTTWNDYSAAMKGKADFLLVDHENKRNIIGDWKTGKPKEDLTQAHLLSLCATAMTGYTENVCMWVFVTPGKTGVVTSNTTVDRGLVSNDLATLKADVGEFIKVVQSGQYQPKPSKLCESWCDVFSCKFNGRTGP